MDIITISQIYQAQDIAQTVAGVRRYTGESSEDCTECGDPIPEARRKFLPGVNLCVGCQTKAEQMRGARL